jgi:hypothetical protein
MSDITPISSFLKMAQALTAILKFVTELKENGHTCISLIQFLRNSKNKNQLQQRSLRLLIGTHFLYIHIYPFNTTNGIFYFYNRYCLHGILCTKASFDRCVLMLQEEAVTHSV